MQEVTTETSSETKAKRWADGLHVSAILQSNRCRTSSFCEGAKLWTEREREREGGGKEVVG